MPFKRPKVLFVSEKWVDCNPARGLSSVHHNFIGSLRATGLADISCFFIDEALIQFDGAKLQLDSYIQSEAESA